MIAKDYVTILTVALLRFKMHANIAQIIYEKVSPMPEMLAQEVLDFADFVAQKHQHSLKEVQTAQLSSLEKIWSGKDDDIWNNLQTY